MLITLGLLRYLDRPTPEISKLFTECRNMLKNHVLSVVSSVALTSDIWSGNAKEDFITVVAHLSLLIGSYRKSYCFRLIEVKRTSENIA